MVVPLTEQFNPDIFLHRENQIDELRKVYTNYKQFGYGGNKLILGVTGSGKTSVTKYIITQENNSIYIDARNENTTNKILKTIVGRSKKTDTADLLRDVITLLKNDKKVLVIDEVDKCKDVKDLASHLTTIYRETTTPMILISNCWNLLNIISDDSWKTLLPSRLEFPAYDSFQLLDILNARLETMKSYMITEMPGECKQYICSRVKKNFNGSARMLLDIALNCIINNNYSFEFVEICIHNKDKETWVSTIKGLSDTEREFLEIMLDLSIEKESILTTDIHQRMTSTISSARVSQIVGSLVKYGIIKTDTKGFGKVGNNYRLVLFEDKQTEEMLRNLVFPYLK